MTYCSCIHKTKSYKNTTKKKTTNNSKNQHNNKKAIIIRKMPTNFHNNRNSHKANITSSINNYVFANIIMNLHFKIYINNERQKLIIP